MGIEVRRDARYDGQPRVSLRGLWRLAKTAIFSFSTFPLAVFSLIGYSALAVFVGLSGFSLFCRLFTDLAVPGWTSNVLVASFFGAVNALGISMLGEYVARIYDQVRGRPMYLVERTVEGTAAVSPSPCAASVQRPRHRRKTRPAVAPTTKTPPATNCCGNRSNCCTWYKSRAKPRLPKRRPRKLRPPSAVRGFERLSSKSSRHTPYAVRPDCRDIAWSPTMSP